MRVTCNALAVEKPLWMIGDFASDILNWYDILLEGNVVPVALYNQRNTGDPLDIEYRVEDCVTGHFDDIGVLQTQLKDTYIDRSSVGNTKNVCKEGSLGRVPTRDRAIEGVTWSYHFVFV